MSLASQRCLHLIAEPEVAIRNVQTESKWLHRGAQRSRRQGVPAGIHAVVHIPLG
jgi:hypothetical protein